MKQYVQELEKRDNRGKREYLKRLLSGLRIPYQVQKFQWLFQKGENIIIDYPFGQENLENLKRILVSAHYDAVPWSPGANDNASAVSVLIEFLKHLKQSRLKKYLRIVFFDKEEFIPPCGGSNRYIEEFGFANLECVYNLEMVGMGQVLMIWGKAGLLETNEASTRLKEGAQKHGMPVIVEPEIISVSKFRRPGFVSDHLPFVEQGFTRAFSLTTIPEEDLPFRRIIEQKKFFRFLGSAARYYFGAPSNFPKILQHYHNKNDQSEFVAEETMQKVFAVLWEAVFNNN